jgi:hypothetical protein
MAEPSRGGGTGVARPKTRSNTLRQAASAVFALTAIVPLLLFVWTVHRLGALSKPQAQVGIGLALAVALAGFFAFRGLMGQMSNLITALGRVLELRERSEAGARATAATSPTRAPRPPAPEPEPARVTEHASVAAVPKASATPAPPPASLPASAPPPEWRSQRAAAAEVPGLGAIREVHDLSRVMVVLWHAEAARYTGRRVVVSVLRSPQPIVGTLIELTDDGLLVRTDTAERVPVSFDQISAIDAEESLTDE